MWTTDIFLFVISSTLFRPSNYILHNFFGWYSAISGVMYKRIYNTADCDITTRRTSYDVENCGWNGWEERDMATLLRLLLLINYSNLKSPALSLVQIQVFLFCFEEEVNSSCMSPGDRGSFLAAWRIARANTWHISIHGFCARNGTGFLFRRSWYQFIILEYHRRSHWGRFTVYIKEVRMSFVGKMTFLWIISPASLKI
jgi:hypothetical protein